MSKKIAKKYKTSNPKRVNFTDSDFLDEEKLGKYLEEIFPKRKWIHNRVFKPYRFQPDYRNDELKLVVEMDGPLHYTSPERIIKDLEKDRCIQREGYLVVRIPMFVQLSTEVIKHLFNVGYQFKQVYPHGFISDKNTLKMPAEFCELGVKRFEKDLERFSYIKRDIIKSLKIKIEKHNNDWRYVLPPSLKYLLD